MPDVTSYLDYGALGLVAIIVAVVAAVAWKGAAHFFNQQGLDAEAKRQARLAQNGFMRNLIERDKNDRVATEKRLESLVQADIEAKKGLSQTFETLCKEIKDLRVDLSQDRRRAEERHDELLSEVRGR